MHKVQALWCREWYTKISLSACVCVHLSYCSDNRSRIAFTLTTSYFLCSGNIPEWSLPCPCKGHLCCPKISVPGCVGRRPRRRIWIGNLAIPDSGWLPRFFYLDIFFRFDLTFAGRGPGSFPWRMSFYRKVLLSCLRVNYLPPDILSELATVVLTCPLSFSCV